MRVNMFADDVMILGHSKTELQSMLNTCTEWAQEKGMAWSVPKCTVIAKFFLPRTAPAHSEVPPVAAEGDTSQEVPRRQRRRTWRRLLHSKYRKRYKHV